MAEADDPAMCIGWALSAARRSMGAGLMWIVSVCWGSLEAIARMINVVRVCSGIEHHSPFEQAGKGVMPQMPAEHPRSAPRPVSAR